MISSSQEHTKMSTLGISTSEILRINKDDQIFTKDLVVKEEPLEIRIGYGPETKRQEFALAVTMRTPGADEELVRGFLLSEGIIDSAEDILSARHCLQAKQPENTLKVELKNDVFFDEKKFQRNFYTSSSCGICGKAALETVALKVPEFSVQNGIPISKETILKLSDQITQQQSNFKVTGGIHAAALFSADGNLLMLREDIGRHNALDKLIGTGSIKKMEWGKTILWLSGRLGFELIQKSAMVGIKTIVGLGAPSSLAVELAQQQNIILIGFLKDNSFNVYSNPDKIDRQN